MTIQITQPEIEEIIKERLESGRFKNAEDVILEALRSSEGASAESLGERGEAIERLRTFGKRHGLSLGGMRIR